MTNFRSYKPTPEDHRRLVTLVLLSFLLMLLLSAAGRAQTPVVLAPLPQLQIFDQNGIPLAFGCVFTYQVNTTNPLATYTDYTGTTQNANPVVLSAGGSANIWLLAGQAYTFVVKASGGTNCAAGSTLYTVNGIGGGSTTLTTNVTFSSTPVFPVAAQVQLFTITLTGNASAQPLTFVGVTPPSIIYFQITQDGSGGHTFSWPSNSIGGCTIGSAANQVTTQEFVYDGSNATAVGPCVTGNGPSIDFGTAIAATSITSPNFSSNSANVAHSGILRLSSTDAIAWRNNANSGDVLLSKDTSDNLIWPNGLSLGGGTALASTNQSGTGSLCMTTNCALGTPSINNAVISGPAATNTTLTCSSSILCTFTAITPFIQQALTTQQSSSSIAVSGSPTTSTIISQAVTMPAAGCPCRVYGSWASYLSTTNAGTFGGWLFDGTNGFASAVTTTTGSSTLFGFVGAGVSTTTYANNAVVTFTLVESQTAGGTVNALQAASGLPVPQHAYISLVVIPNSN